MNQAATPLPPPVLDAIRSGRTIDAIRLLREATGMDLKSAKDLIDAHARGAAASVSYTQSPGGAKAVPAVTLSLVAMLDVVLNPLWSWVGVGEVPTQSAFIGGAIIVGAVVISIFGDRWLRQRGANR